MSSGGSLNTGAGGGSSTCCGGGVHRHQGCHDHGLMTFRLDEAAAPTKDPSGRKRAMGTIRMLMGGRGRGAGVGRGLGVMIMSGIRGGGRRHTGGLTLTLG